MIFNKLIVKKNSCRKNNVGHLVHLKNHNFNITVTLNIDNFLP